MTAWLDLVLTLLSWSLLLCGAFFFIAGTVGLLRFPDIYCRLHAVTKADTLGLGLLLPGLALQADSPDRLGTLLLVWLLVMGSGATACQMLARYARETEAPVDDP
ncbi:monovalent cation/H(+) antiporter subunit G [Natronospirillum operosum]|uniref:monovalent cation/H(+) antiporter subunit G n=1 Tax=Natronospirillum operosum TaxID=2759953 RepID=UPI00197C0480|nr:monovalent cation/H(+) antiporter subunit G [Natronospirillum operosum]